MASGSGCFITT